MILWILGIIILISGVISISNTQTVHTLKSENVNRFPENHRRLNNDNTNNILSAPVITVKFNDNIDIYPTYHKIVYDRTSIIIDRNDKSDLNNDYDDDVNINTEINESENPKIRKYRNNLRNIVRSKREIRQKYNDTLKTYYEFIEVLSYSIHPDMVKNYDTELLSLKNELNELKKISNVLVHAIIEETQLDEFEKLNLS
jgi:hypothetical protein